MPEIIGWEDVGADIVGADGDVRQAKNLPQSVVGSALATVPASGSLTVAVPVARNIRPDRMYIDRVQAQSLVVNSMSIGTVNLFLSGNPVPADMFAPDAVGASFRALETATPSVPLQVVVSNKTTTAVDNFCVGIIGPSDKPLT
jgi:hypothetical protein